MRQDMLGAWLPLALCAIFRQTAAAWGARPPGAAEVFRTWGLDALADEAEGDATNAALAAFAGAIPDNGRADGAEGR